MSYGLGVDLGTSFTGAALSHAGQARMVTLGEQTILMPSVVRVQPDGSLLTGDRGARSASADDPDRTGRNFKRRLGDPTPLVLGGQPHSAVSLLAATLASVLEAATRLEGTPTPDGVVLTFPAVWGPYRREQFAEVPRRAGLDAVTVISEPEAAATHYAARRQLDEGDVIAVYDLGGGTFDTTVTRVTARGVEILGVPEGVEWIGGVDFDEAVLAHVDRAVGGAVSALDPRDPASALTLQRVRQECVLAKETLSRDPATSVSVPLPGRPTQVALTRDEFEAMIRTPLESTLESLHRTLNSAGITPAELAGVLLVGGSSRIPLVARMLSEDLGRPVLLDPQPQHCVALGAAAIAENAQNAQNVENRSAITAAVRARRWPIQPSGRRRRHLLAATAAGVLIVGGVVYAGRSESPVPVAGPKPTVGPQPGLIGSPVAESNSPSGLASPSPSPSASPKASRKPSPSPSRAPAFVQTTGVVLAIGGKCLDVANGLSDNGGEVEIFSCNSSAAQSWTLAPDRTFRALGKCLDADPERAVGAAANPQVQLQECTGGAHQRWQITRGTIVHSATKLCLSVLDNSVADRTPLFVGACNGEGGQLWTIPNLPAADTS